MKKSNRPQICFTSLYSYSIFNPACVTPFGGSEVRLAAIAKGLARRGRFDVSVIVYDHDQPAREKRDNVTLVARKGFKCSLQVAPTPPPPTALERFRKLKNADSPYLIRRLAVGLGWRLAPIYWRMLSQREALRVWLQKAGNIGPYIIEKGSLATYEEVDADVYLVPGASEIGAELAFYCQKAGKKYALLAGSDQDFSPEYKTDPEKYNCYGVPGYLANYAIERADLLLVQNERQAELLRQNYGRSSIVIRNPIDLSQAVAPSGQARTILWVGKSDRIKRPEIVLQLARHMPEYKFKLIMNYSNSAIHQQCHEEAATLPNVTIINYVPFAEVEHHFADALLLLNTSVFEGFPNTFLQAAKYGVPIITYNLDPGEMLTKHQCGLLSGGEFTTFRDNVRLLLTTPALYQEISANCRAYVAAYHDQEKIISAYEEALLALTRSETAVKEVVEQAA